MKDSCSNKKQIIFWLIFFVLFFTVIWQLEAILLPFILGMAVSYFLDPVVDRLEEHNLNRTASVAIVLGVFGAFFATLIFLIVPTLYSQMLEFYHALPSYINKLKSLASTHFGGIIPPNLFSMNSLDELNKTNVTGLNDMAGTIGKGLFKTIWNSGNALFSFLSVIFITPIVAFYLLRDWDLMINKFNSWLPHDYKKEIKQIFTNIDTTLAGFVRGQATVCFILGIFYSVSLMLLGLNFGLFIGIGAGLIAFIPYFGAIIGMGAALIVAWFQLGEPSTLAIVATIFFAGQMLEGNFLTPKLIGEKIGLHAVWVIFALMAGGELLGFVGVMIAVPTAAIVGVLIRFALDLYLKSEYYHGKKTTTPKSKVSKKAKVKKKASKAK